MASNYNKYHPNYAMNEYSGSQNPSRTKKTVLAYEVPLQDPFKSSPRRNQNQAFTQNTSSSADYRNLNDDPFKLYGQRLESAHNNCELSTKYMFSKKTSTMLRNMPESVHSTPAATHRNVANATPRTLHQDPNSYAQNVNNNNYNSSRKNHHHHHHNHSHRSRQHLKYTKDQYEEYQDNETSQLMRPKSPTTKLKEPLVEDHYNHYFFYEYNRTFSPPPSARKKTTRKLPTLVMSSYANKAYTAEENSNLAEKLHAVHNNNPRKNRELENQNGINIHEFKGKTVNNNDALTGSDARIIKRLVSGAEVKGGGDYFDTNGVNGNTVSKKLTTQKQTLPVQLEGQPYPPIHLHNGAYSLVSQETAVNGEKDEKRKPRQLSTSANTKKPKAPRVLLYNTNSPRLQGKSSINLIGKPSAPRFNETKRSLAMSPVRQSRIQVKQQIKSDTDLKPPPPSEYMNGVVLANRFSHNINNNSDDTDTDYDDVDDFNNGSDFIASDDSESSEDAEEGYRTHTYRMIHPSDRLSGNHSSLSPQTSEENIRNPPSLLTPSLFPNVPPYLSFSTNQEKGPDVPPELHRILKWRVSNVMPKVVRCVLSNSGMRLVKKTNEWMGVWGKHMKSPCFKAIRPYQKINHLPGSFKIGRKDSCWRNLKKNMGKHSKRDFGFMPRTYIIPTDLHNLRKHWPRYAQKNVKWIIKPPASARGAGIRVINRWAQIPKRKPLIVQRYIERPLLINGSKFDLRLYVLVTSINPLRVFLYHNGLARFASVKYSDRSETLNDRCMHLTNYSINKFSSNYSKNEDVNACHGHKWTLKSLWTYLANRGVRTDHLWEAMRNLVLRTVLAGESTINNMIKYNVESKYSCYELFGFDVILDSELIPWLLEVNISPSLHSDLPLDAHVKAPLVQSVLNTALYNIPPKLTLEKQRELASQMNYQQAGSICYDKRLYVKYLSRAEKLKHETFTRKGMEDRNEYIHTILEHLTPDDVRCLIIAEDELARSGPLERIFPTNQTYRYLKYTENPRYYNRLLDAWETRYGNNRAAGIELLRRYCEVKYHLQVPPSPAKKDSNAEENQNDELANESQKTDIATEDD